jgi:AraC-like DNA-binding protein
MTRNTKERQTIPTTADICAHVWHWLEMHPDVRPRLSDLASTIGMSPRALRRAWQHTGRPRLRELITYGCLSYAAWLIATDGWKPIAAARQAGFRSYWNLNRQCKKYTGSTVRHCAGQVTGLINTSDVLSKVARLRVAVPGAR